VLVVFQIESNLCSKFVVVFLVPMFIALHLFANLLLFVPMTVTLMWLVFTIMITDMMWSKYALVVVALMLDQSDPFVVFQLCVPQFVFALLFL
jgi:hypothetical protein